MEDEASYKVLDKCCCCTAEGNHENEFGIVYIEFFKKCLNLNLENNSHINQVICSSCVDWVKEIQQFRSMVVSSQRQLMDVKYDDAMFIDDVQQLEGTEDTLCMNGDKIKIEDEESSELCLENISTETIDQKQETELKTELEQSTEYTCDWDTYEDNEVDIKIEDKPKTKRKRLKEDSVKIKKKKRKKYDSDTESDTPISQIKKSQLKSKIKKESKSTKSSALESKHYSFIENNKVRSNIILILKNSTILPFRNNFKSTFKCFYCEKLYIPFKELKDHIEKEHSDVTEATITKIIRTMQNLIVTADISCIRCKICNDRCDSIDNLVQHLKSTHKKVYHEADKKPSHGILGVDLSTDALKCHLCEKDFAFFKNLSIHMNEHYGSFVCYVCGKKFLSEHRYKCHVSKAHTEQKTICKHCGKTFSTEPAMAYHIRKEHLKHMIKCVKCPETFLLGQYDKRLNHMAKVHGIKKPIFKCDTCGKEYANSGSLAAHKRYTHKRIKELRCEICGYITVHNTVMKKHMDVHNGIKNYQCEYCKKKFGKPYTLKLHLKIHLNDKRFACTLCEAAFIQKNSLKSHLKSRHPDSGIDIGKL